MVGKSLVVKCWIWETYQHFLFVKRKGKLLSVEYEKPIMLIQDIFLASYNLNKDIYENVFNLANLDISWAKEKYQDGKLAEDNNG